MENEKTEETINQYECILRDAENDNSLTVTNIKFNKRPSLGFMSNSKIIEVTGKRGDGTDFIKNYFIKNMVQTQLHNELRQVDCFINEAYYYTMLSHYFENLGPKPLYACVNGIILEDLYVEGYNCKKTNEMLNYKECKASLEHIARLHATSLHLKLKDEKFFINLVNELQEISFIDGTEFSMGRFTENAIRFVIDDLQLQMVDAHVVLMEECRSYKIFLSSQKENIYNTIKALVTHHNEKYNVLTHGDFWKNNILFKETNEELLVKLVDFQAIRHCSVALDILHLIYSSAESFVLENQFDQLIKDYYKYFVSYLQKLNVAEQHIENISMEWLQRELQNYALYGAIMGIMTALSIHATESDGHITPGLEISVNYLLNRQGEHVQPKTDRILLILKHFYHRFVRDGVWHSDII